MRKTMTVTMLGLATAGCNPGMDLAAREKARVYKISVYAGDKPVRSYRANDVYVTGGGTLSFYDMANGKKVRVTGTVVAEEE